MRQYTRGGEVHEAQPTDPRPPAMYQLQWYPSVAIGLPVNSSASRKALPCFCEASHRQWLYRRLTLPREHVPELYKNLGSDIVPGRCNCLIHNTSRPNSEMGRGTFASIVTPANVPNFQLIDKY